MFIINAFKDLANCLIALEKNLGFRMFVKYTLYLLLIVVVLNYRTVVKEAVEFVAEINSEIHIEKMKLQDSYYRDLTPLLAEFRAEVGADRVMYFEFHNSVETLEGLPFKFFDLVKCVPEYGIPEVQGDIYKNVNAAMYSELFFDINNGKILTCHGVYDKSFNTTYRGIYKLINESDHTEQMVIFSVPGIRRPIGFIILEWMDHTEDINVDPKVINKFLPRINAISAHVRN